MKKEFKYTGSYFLIDDYKFPKNLEEWDNCPVCNLKPKIWVFDNGRQTGCGCHNSRYDHRSIQAESIMSCHRNDGDTSNYDSDGLRKNWNCWCNTGEFLFLVGNGRW
jgi:hypothetical protein